MAAIGDQRRANRGILASQDGRGQERRVGGPGTTNRQGTHGNASWHLHGREQGVDPPQRPTAHGDTEDGKQRVGCGHTRQVRGHPRCGDDDFDALRFGAADKVQMTLWRPVGGYDARLVTDGQGVEGLGRAAHDLPVRGAAHQDSDPRRRPARFFRFHPRLSRRHSFSSPVPQSRLRAILYAMTKDIAPLRIGPRTALCGVVLHPAAHTRSPALHNAAFAALGLDAVYLAFDVPPERLGEALRGARALGVRQLSVSIPHKRAVFDHLDRVDDTARAIGAVNTILACGDALLGSNSDWSGALRALEREGPVAGRDAVVLGAGGTARAVVYGLVRGGARVRVLNRSRDRAEHLVRELGAWGFGGLGEVAAGPCDILVNTTSVGLGCDLSPLDAEAIPPGAVVLDAVYDPPCTRLLRDARARGARTISGKWMLVYQAAEQLSGWSGCAAPLDAMARAFDAAGAERGGPAVAPPQPA